VGGTSPCASDGSCPASLSLLFTSTNNGLSTTRMVVASKPDATAMLCSSQHPVRCPRPDKGHPKGPPTTTNHHVTSVTTSAPSVLQLDDREDSYKQQLQQLTEQLQRATRAVSEQAADHATALNAAQQQERELRAQLAALERELSRVRVGAESAASEQALRMVEAEGKVATAQAAMAAAVHAKEAVQKVSRGQCRGYACSPQGCGAKGGARWGQCSEYACTLRGGRGCHVRGLYVVIWHGPCTSSGLLSHQQKLPCSALGSPTAHPHHCPPDTHPHNRSLYMCHALLGTCCSTAPAAGE
jgi:hypothetical protein